jgi:hypothetical protein
MKRHLLDSIGKIRASKREILQSTSKTAVLSSIRHRGAVCSGELGPSVHRSRCRVALGHASALEEFHSVLALREKKPTGGPRDCDPEEVMQIPEISHGELRVEELGDAP